MELDPKRSSRVIAMLAAVSLGMMTLAASLEAGLAGFGARQAVGGVMIDASGVVRTATLQEQRELAALVRQAAAPVDRDLGEVSERRMISLNGLQQAIKQARQQAVDVPDAVEYLAGLQRIEYVFVDPENRDIVVAGPAEPWTVREDGSVVGAISGGATMRLADLIVAIRSVEQARTRGISCSIEPTPEGRRRLQQFLAARQARPGQNPKMLEASMKEAYGPQVIQLTGIDGATRYARTLVAADYEMKRIAMGLRDSPVADLPSYLQMARNSRQAAGQNPRWWMACDYEGLAKSKDGLTWRLTGQGVKTMTEQDIVERDGTVRESGRKDKAAQLWADKMTGSYSELAREIPVFSDLQSVMDATVVATLIVQEGLAEKAGIDLSTLTGSDSIELTNYAVPQFIDPQCSFIRGSRGWVVTASGGVDINAFEVVQRHTTDDLLGQTRTAAFAGASDQQWWWDEK